MDINVRYTGLSTVPSDYDSGDGELAAVVNMVPEDGGLKPMQPPKDTGITLDAGQMLIFIHKTGSFTHYIITQKTEDSEKPYKLSWIGGGENGNINSFADTVRQVTALGSTLIISTAGALYYARWKDDKYIFLGSKPPQIKADIIVNTMPYTSTVLESTEGEYASFQDYIDNNQFDNLLKSDNPNAVAFIDKDKKEPFANLVFSIVNRMTKKISELGLFYSPYLLRLAYRLYDGSRIMYTAPHLIVPTSTGKPLLFLRKNGKDGPVSAMFIIPRTTVAFNFYIDKDAELWSDVITNIDVIATPQIIAYTADNEGIESVGKVTQEELDTFTIATAGGHCYRPTLIDLTSNAYVNIYAITSQKITYRWNGIWSSGATYAYIDTKNYPYDGKLVANVNTNPLHDSYGTNVEFPTITTDEAIKIGLPVTASFKVYIINKEALFNKIKTELHGVHEVHDADISGYYIIKNGYVRKSPMYWVKDKETLDTSQCLSIKLKRADGDSSLSRQIVSASSYHLLYDKIKYEDLIKKRTDNEYYVSPVYAKSDILNINVKQTIADDYRSGDTLIPGYAFTYNNRINIAVDALIPFEGDDMHTIFDYPFEDLSGQNELPRDEAIFVTDMYVEIFENGMRYFAHTALNEDKAGWFNFSLQFLTWYFYPNINARYVYFKTYKEDRGGNVTGYKLLRIQLTQHDFLNGAYAYNDMLTLDSLAEEIASGDDEENTYSDFNNTLESSSTNIPVHNKIYTSEVNNPFLFPVSGINTVGTGRIFGISSAVKALSQGQFGQFPLYAFTTDGVWALQVSDTGTYSARQPVTRDVCINAASITQIDTAVLFATSRGIMLIEGSETVCMTDVLSGEDTLRLNALPHIGQIARLSDFDEKDFVTEDFMAFIEKCRMIYDYRHQRIIVYKPMEESAPLPTPPQKDGQATTSYAYVYSLKSKQWGMLKENIAYGVRSYPDALAVLRTGAKDSLVNFSEEAPDAEKNYRGIVITRPLKLGMPDVLKTVNTVVQRGYFRRGHVRCALYASRDMYNWFMVWSSTDHYLRGFSGTPYKYYRMVLLCDLDDDENLAGCTVRFVPKMMNRLR